MTPSVTVLLAVRNGGAYLREAVESVLDQTNGDFELLLVDDASTDDAIDALPRDPRIRVLRNETNLGQIPSLNRGLREARAPLVARLDHDDVCLPNRLERQLAVFAAEPHVTLVASWADIVDQGRLWTRVRPRIDSFVEFAGNAVTYHLELVHPTLMFRRDAILDLGGFDERLGAAEDQELYRRLVLARREARVVPETLVHYRRHEQQMTFAKAAVVLENDARSYERFVGALDAAAPAATLQRLFVGDPTVWTSCRVDGDMLESFLDAASNRLALSVEERTIFGRTLARKVAASTRAAWSTGAYGQVTRGAVLFAARHGTSVERRLALAAPALAATAPLGAGLARGRRSARRLLTSELLTPARRHVRRWRLLRWLYSRALHVRPPSG